MGDEKGVRIVVNDLFFEQVKDWLRQSKKVKIPVVGHSMFPTFKNGDKVLLAPVSKVQLGDVVLATYNKTYVLHRVVGWNRSAVRLVGDGNVGQIEFVSKTEIWARVVGTYRENLEIERTNLKWRLFGLCWYVLRPVRIVVMRCGILKTKLNKENDYET
ncbi:S24/S26 family peptidase [Sphingobacterium sp. SYP-B4668]|uniref:S24/S26 family peptidase n=1 Tax=Sphingobacterium sp. SYP-B4668 TaxID=2996035 RepID=UPI0022DE0E87|nr:S24/S26 family peptidase [Sphingobacterium sp. SYP-B4668]